LPRSKESDEKPGHLFLDHVVDRAEHHGEFSSVVRPAELTARVARELALVRDRGFHCVKKDTRIQEIVRVRTLQQVE